MTTGERIKALRIAKGFSQEELGQKIGVKKAAVNKYESGLVVNLKRSVIEKLAAALDTTPIYLMGFDPTTPTTQAPTPVSEDERSTNVVKIAGRDGSFREKRLDDKGLQALIAFVDLLPDAPDNI